jgi:hypothetical protein
MDFKRYILEKKKESAEAPEETTAVMAFGRFNPPTVGHEKLIKKVHDVAKEHGGEAHIVASHSQGTMKDPLPQDKKLQYLKSISHGQVNVSGSSKEEPTIFHAATRLHNAGHSHLVIVAGSDRVDEYQKLLDKYNGVKGKHGYYNFKSIKVISAGQRDPDAEGVVGMSGTKMRDLARSGNLAKFMSGLPEALRPHAKEIMDHIRGIQEDYENPYRFDWGTPGGTEYMKKMTPGMKTECGVGEVWSKEKGMCVSIREAYVAGDVHKLNDIVESVDGIKGKIVYRGASYVTIQLESGDTKKIWLKDIQTLQENAPLPSKPIVTNKMSKFQVPILLMTKKQIEEKLAPAKITYKELKEMYRERDINFTDDKEVRMGIDKEIPDQHVDGKSVGLVSFKTYIQGEAAKVAKEYQKNTDSIRQAQDAIDMDAHHMHHPQVKLNLSAED